MRQDERAQKKEEAHALLQIVNDSYARTRDLKAKYEAYDNLLFREKFPGFIPLTEEEILQLQKYKEVLALYEENVEGKIFWIKDLMNLPAWGRQAAPASAADILHTMV